MGSSSELGPSLEVWAGEGRAGTRPTPALQGRPRGCTAPGCADGPALWELWTDCSCASPAFQQLQMGNITGCTDGETEAQRRGLGPECAPTHPPRPCPRALPQSPPARTLVTVDPSGTDVSGHPVQLLVPHSAPGIPCLGGVARAMWAFALGAHSILADTHVELWRGNPGPVRTAWGQAQAASGKTGTGHGVWVAGDRVHLGSARAS